MSNPQSKFLKIIKQQTASNPLNKYQVARREYLTKKSISRTNSTSSKGEYLRSTSIDVFINNISESNVNSLQKNEIVHHKLEFPKETDGFKRRKRRNSQILKKNNNVFASNSYNPFQASSPF